MRYLNCNILSFVFAILLFPIVSVFAQSDSLKTENFLQKGKDFYADGYYEKAILQFTNAYDLQVKRYGPESEQVMKTLYRLGSAYRKMRNHPDAMKVYTQGLEIAQKISGPESEDVIDFYWGLGATRSQMYDPKGAMEYYEKCLAAYSKIYGPESSEAGNMYMNIGGSFHKMADYHDAEKYYQKAFQIFTKSSDPQSEDFNRIYSNMGYLYRKVGNYDRAIEFGEKALEIKLKHYDPMHPSVAKYHRNIGRAFQGKNEFEQALPYLLETVEIYEKSLGKKHPETGGAYGELGNLYADMGEYKTALKYYEKARKIQEATLSPTHPYLVGGYFNIGTVYEDMGDFDKAIDMYDFALQKFKSRVYPPKNLIAESQRKIAAVLFRKGDIDSALVLIQLSLQEIAPNFTFEKNDFYKNPDLKKIQDESDLLNLLNSKSYFLEGKFEKTTDLNDLKVAFNTIELAIQLIEKMRKSYQSEDARQFLNSKTAVIYIKAVQLSFDLYELTKNDDYLFKAFEISEKSKASILWQNLSENLALQNTSIPQADRDVLNQLEAEIAELEEQLFEDQQDEAQIKHLQSQIFDLKLEYENRIAAIEKQNPKYFQLKYKAPDIELHIILDKLPNSSTAIVEYFYTDENLYTFVISKSGLTGKKTELRKPLAENISQLRENNVASLINNNSNNGGYISSLNELHRILIEPVLPVLKNAKKIIVIPHGVLQYLPFEMLTSQTSDDFRTLDYIIRKYTIQYEWSVAFWLNESPGFGKRTGQFIGFAPSFFDIENEIADATATFRAELSNLSYSIPEVENANAYFPGEIFIGDQATESLFRQNAPNSRIIHLATHAFTDDIQPLRSGLAFANDSIEDGFLNAYEIYNLDLPADLAVMSACNTGYGQLAEGEGVMSLGRAFSYAGCKSVVMSLWLANDQSTSTLMNSFYKNLSTGMAKDESLQKAKIDYLENADQLTAHPYFWAGIVAMGDMSPVSGATHFEWWILLVLGFVLILLFAIKKLYQ